MKFANPDKGIFFMYNKTKAKKLKKIYINKTGNTKIDLIINYLPISTTKMIIEQFEYKRLIYDCVKDFENWENAPVDVKYYERILVNKADAVLVDSYFLLNKIEKKFQIKAFQFLPIVTNDWLEGCKANTIKENICNFAYFGTIDEHIDVEIFKMLTLKGYKIHIWGKINKNLDFDYIYHGFKNDMKILVKEILQYSDAILIPYKGNMDGVIPTKIMQALSTMLPVFCSTFYDSRFLNNYLYLYEEPSKLINLIEEFNYKMHQKKNKEIEKYLKDKDEIRQYEYFKKVIDEELD